MKKLGFIITMLGMCFLLSGCMTILGGIIGHQSGEAVAGAAIGAALDFGDDIVRGIGGLLEDKSKPVSIHPDMGYIWINCKKANCHRIFDHLEKRFQEKSWAYNRIEHPSNCDKVRHSIYQIATPEQKEFTLETYREKDQMRLYVNSVGPDTQNVDMITSRIGLWIEECTR